MARLVAGAGGVDMSAWDAQLADITSAAMGEHDASHFVLAGDTHDFTLTGKHFTYSDDVNPAVTGGIVSGLTVSEGGVTDFALSRMHAPASTIMGEIGSGNWGAFAEDAFSGNDTFIGSAVNDHFLGFAGDDTFDLAKRGEDIADGGDGGDTFEFGKTFDAGDQVIGGDSAHTDTLVLRGGRPVAFTATTMSGVERIDLTHGHNYSLTLVADNVGSNGLTIDAFGLLDSDEASITLDPAGTNRVTFHGGQGGDTYYGTGGFDDVRGNDGDDFLFGAGGYDFLSGGLGSDTYAYDLGSNASLEYIGDLDAKHDKIALEVSVTGIDAPITVDTLSEDHLYDELAAKVTSLGAGHAAIVTADAGFYRREPFLLVDCNGTTGYQPGEDFVAHIDSLTGVLDTGDFTLLA